MGERGRGEGERENEGKDREMENIFYEPVFLKLA